MFRKIRKIPEEVKAFLYPFRPYFANRSQFKHFCRYVYGLILADGKSVEDITNAFIDAPNRSNTSRFFSEAVWDFELILNIAIGHFFSKIDFKWGTIGYLVFDDTANDKTGTSMDGAFSFKTHNRGPYRFGHQILVALLCYKGQSIPVGIRLYLTKDFCAKKNLPFRTKNEMVAEMLAQYRAPKGLKIRVLFDAWYANPTVMKAIEQRGFHAVGVLHCNRKIVVDGKEYRADEYALMQLKYFEPKVFTPRGTTGAVDALDVICHVKTLGIIKLVISKDKKGNFKFIFTTTLSLKKEEILRRYDIRWSIECFFRDVKQHLGFTDYQMRFLIGIIKHLYLVMVAYLTIMWVKCTLAEKGIYLKTVGDVYRWLEKQNTQDLILWIMENVNSKKQKEYVMQKLQLNA